MPNKNSILPPENQELIRAEVLRQQTELQKKVVESNWRLTQHNFLANAGGAIAVLGYMGSERAESWAIFPLIIFAVGIISSTVEIRALLETYGALHKAVSECIDRITGRDFTTEDAMLEKNAGTMPGKINMYASYVSQSSFILGVIIGGGVYLHAL